jgi:hypothetical protein
MWYQLECVILFAKRYATFSPAHVLLACRVTFTPSTSWLAQPLLFPLPDKDVVRDGVPGIVNANEEQQQRRAGDKEKRGTGVEVACTCRYNQRYVCY